MYTMEWNCDPDVEGQCNILDPDGNYICTVMTECQAEALLIHLNEGNQNNG